MHIYLASALGVGGSKGRRKGLRGRAEGTSRWRVEAGGKGGLSFVVRASLGSTRRTLGLGRLGSGSACKKSARGR